MMHKVFLPFVSSGSDKQWRLNISIEQVDGDILDIDFGPSTNQINILGWTSVKLTPKLTLAVSLIEELTE